MSGAEAPAREAAPAIEFQRGPLKRAEPAAPSAEAIRDPLEFEKRNLLAVPQQRSAAEPSDDPALHFERRELLLAPEPPPVPVAGGDGLPVPVFDGDTLRPNTPGSEPEELVAPMPLSASAPTDQRIEAMLAYLERGGPRFDAISMDTAFIGAHPPAIRLACPSEFKLRVARGIQEHPRVALALSTLLPDCRRVELHLRTDDGPPYTRRERSHRARQAQIQQLTQAVTDRPLHNQLQDRFNAQLGAVVPADEPPPLPSRAR